MSDVKIADSVALTRSLNEFKYLDEQERAHTARMASAANLKEIEDEQHEVDETERPITDGEDKGSKKQHQNARSDGDEDGDGKDEPPVELSEGHLLDLKA